MVNLLKQPTSPHWQIQFIHSALVVCYFLLPSSPWSGGGGGGGGGLQTIFRTCTQQGQSWKNAYNNRYATHADSYF